MRAIEPIRRISFASHAHLRLQCGCPPALAWLAASLVAGQLVPAIAFASPPEYLIADRSVATRVEDEKAPMQEAYAKLEIPEGEVDAFAEALADKAPFWRDSRFYARPRAYYLERQRDNRNDSVAAAYGGWISGQTGQWRERLSLQGTLFTTQRAYGPSDKDGTGLLGPGQDGFWVLGELNAELRLTENLAARLYRQSFNLPYLNRQDSRMVPNTFEAYTLTKDSGGHFKFLASHVLEMKTRTSDDFVSMAQAAGFDDEDEPLTVGAASWQPREGLSFGAAWQYAWEFLSTWYGDANIVFPVGNDVSFALGAQYTGQKSVGSEIGGELDTYVYGGKVAASYNNAILTLAFTSTGGNRIRNPFGGYPGYISLMIRNFNRAREDGWLIGLSYDFAKVGIPGLSAFVNYADGDTPDRGSDASPDQTEFNITVDYRVPYRPLKGLWFRARAGFLDQEDDVIGASDEEDYRLIVNYEVSFL